MTKQESLVRCMVASGAAFLDKARPGWEQNIDINILEMMDGSKCILGQLFGDYLDGKDTLQINSDIASHLGFGCTISYYQAMFGCGDRDTQLKIFDNDVKEEWKLAITARE